MPRFHLGHLRESSSLFTSLTTRVKPWLTTKIALQVGLSEPEIEDIKLAAIVHDIGKINVPEDVLHKPTLLTEEEFEK